MDVSRTCMVHRGTASCLLLLWRCCVLRHRMSITLGVLMLLLILLASRPRKDGNVSSLLQRRDRYFRLFSQHLSNINPALTTTVSHTPTPTQTRENEAGGRREEHHHVFFLKVHKAASTTVMNVLYRFALRRNLTVALPRRANLLSQGTRRWLRRVVPLPPGVRHFDILCNHIAFQEEAVRKLLPSDAKFVGIVRHPLSQFVSAFHYYRNVFYKLYLRQIPGKSPIHTYLQDPEKYDTVHFNQTFTHNRMSFDFGMNDTCLHGDDGCLADYVSYLTRTFQLVMVSERFDESMVLLRRLLGWGLHDLLYIKNNVFAGNSTASPHLRFTETEKQVHKAFNRADYVLYEHFSQLLDRRVKAEGEDFQQEVNTYQALLREAADYCAVATNHTAPLLLKATPWSDRFYLGAKECTFLKAKETEQVKLMRSEQLKRFSKEAAR